MSRRNRSRGGRRGSATPVSGFDPNKVLGLVIDLDARDLTAGAVTSWTDRKNGYAFSGTATRDAAINGVASVTFNGTSNILTSASVTQLAAKSAITMVVLGLDTHTSATTGVICEIGNGVAAGSASLSAQTTGTRVYSTCAGNVGTSSSYIDATLAGASVVSAVVDFSSAAAAETSTMRLDGAAPTVTAGVSAENTGTFASAAISLGARVGGSLYWGGSLGRVLVYDRRLTTAEMQYLEAGLLEQGVMFNPRADFTTMSALYRETMSVSQWTDLAGTRHATQATAGNQPTFTASDAAFNGQPSLSFTTDDYMNVGGAASTWAFLHDTTDATFYMVFRPSTVTGETKYLWNSIGDLVANNRGVSLLYHATTQTAEVFVGNGGTARCVQMIGADSEVARDTPHVLVYRKSAAGFDLWLDGTQLITGEYNGTPSSTAASVAPSIGGYSAYAATRQFEGKMAEIGVLPSNVSPARITNYCKARYAITTARTVTHRSLFRDGINLNTGAPANGSAVWSWYGGVSATPGTTRQIARVINRATAHNIQTRTNGTPASATIGNDNRYRVATVPLTASGVFADSRPLKALLIVGESCARGRSSVVGLPGGYPPASGAIYAWTGEDTTLALPAIEQPVYTYGVDGILNSDSGTPGVGPGGLAAWYLQTAESGASVWLSVNCGKGSTTSTNWNGSTTNTGVVLGATLARVRRVQDVAESLGKSVQWVGIYIDQGVNDATSASPTWDTNWSAIETTLRAEPLLASVPIVYRKEPALVPTDVSYPGWSTVRAQQEAWQKSSTPKRIMVSIDPLPDYVEAAKVHPGTVANAQIGSAVSTAIRGA